MGCPALTYRLFIRDISSSSGDENGMYAYVTNNPIAFVDPMGTMARGLLTRGLSAGAGYIGGLFSQPEPSVNLMARDKNTTENNSQSGIFVEMSPEQRAKFNKLESNYDRMKYISEKVGLPTGMFDFLDENGGVNVSASDSFTYSELSNTINIPSKHFDSKDRLNPDSFNFRDFGGLMNETFHAFKSQVVRGDSRFEGLRQHISNLAQEQFREIKLGHILNLGAMLKEAFVDGPRGINLSDNFLEEAMSESIDSVISDFVITKNFVDRNPEYKGSSFVSSINRQVNIRAPGHNTEFGQKWYGISTASQRMNIQSFQAAIVIVFTPEFFVNRQADLQSGINQQFESVMNQRIVE